MELKLGRAEVERLIHQGPEGAPKFFELEELRPGFARLRMPFRKWMVRIGDSMSGPALFTAADLALFAIVLAHVGPAVMAVTADLNIRFLSKGRLEDIVAETRILKLGSRLVVGEVQLRCGDDPALVAHVTASYSLPSLTEAAPA